MDSDDPALDRRAFLATVGAGLLAGCTSDPEPTATAPGTDAPTDSATATPTDAPATATDTAASGTPEPRPLDDAWSAYGYDLGNSGFNPESGAVTGRDVQWSQAVEGDNTLPEPAVTADHVLVASETYVYAIDRVDGTLDWRTDLGIETYFYTPAVVDGVAYAVGRGLGGAYKGTDTPGTMAALDLATGEQRWSREAYVTSSPVVHDGRVHYAASTADRGFVRAAAADDGSEVWEYPFGGPEVTSVSLGTPALDGDALYATGTVGGDAGRLFALDPAAGSERWRLDTDAALEHAPACSDGDVFLSDEAGTLYAVDTASGSVRWTTDLPEAPPSKPTVGNGLVYVLADDHLHAVDRSDGTRRWKAEIGPVQSTITLTSDVVYVGGNQMDAFDATTGERRWQRSIDGYSGAYGVPAVVDEYMYVGACVKDDPQAIYDNYVYLLG
jgi:outer membrane protein assembly factor BamB